jgi:RimJ/RimL family protein N-acetyltransferase
MKAFHETSKPIFAITSDQDWAPPWAAAALMALLEPFRVPVHVFRTSACPVFDRAHDDGRITIGWHPNFLPESSHGATIPEVIKHLQELFPGCKTVRTHCFVENTFIWDEIAKAGIVADSQLASFYQGNLEPIKHWTGIYRFPIFFEDDLFIRDGGPLDLKIVRKTLFSPGLKILNFHASFVAANVPSAAYYEQVKSRIFSKDGSIEEVRFAGRGASTVVHELLTEIKNAGYEFISFLELVERTRVAENSDLAK